MSKQQKILLTSIVLFLLGGLVLAAYLARQIAKPTPRAAIEEATLTLEPSNPNPAPGEQITVAVFAAPPTSGTQIRTLSAYIEYNESIQIVEVARSNQAPFDQWDYIKARNNPARSRVEILASYKPLDAEPDPAGYLAGNMSAEFALIKLVWGDPELDQQTPGYLGFVTAPATTGAKDPAGNDIPVSTRNLTIPSIGQPSPTPIPGVGQGAFHLEPSSGQFQSGETFVTRVLFDTDGADVTSVDALIKFDPRIVEVSSIEAGSAFPQNFTTEDKAPNMVYAGGAVASADEPVNGNGLHLTTITWLAKPEITLPGGDEGAAPPLVTTDVSFVCTPGRTDDSNINRSDRDTTDILNCALITNGSYTIEFPPFQADKPSLYLSPTRGNINAGQQFTSTIYLNTGGNDVAGVDAVVTFDQTALNIVSTAKGNIPEFIAYFEDIDNDAGRVTVSQLISPDVTEVTPPPQTAGARPKPRPNQTPVNGQGLKFATLTFKALPIRRAASASSPRPIDVETTVNFDFTPGNKNDSNIAEYHQGGDILAAIYGATYTISYEPAEGTRLKLKLELCDEPSQRKVEIKLPDGTLLETNLSGKNDGKMHTTDPLNIPDGTQSLIVRVYGYLAHTYNLPSRWSSLIDLSYFTLLGGDIDGSGRVNVLDFNLFKSDYQKDAETPADLDCSDQVNSLDYDGVIRNWNKKSD